MKINSISRQTFGAIRITDDAREKLCKDIWKSQASEKDLKEALIDIYSHHNSVAEMNLKDLCKDRLLSNIPIRKLKKDIIMSLGFFPNSELCGRKDISIDIHEPDCVSSYNEHKGTSNSLYGSNLFTLFAKVLRDTRSDDVKNMIAKCFTIQ